MEKDKNYSFIAYIDESGDIGIREGKIGSSRWFGMSSFIIPASKDLDLVNIRDNIVEKYSTTPKHLKSEDKIIHMKDIKKDEVKLFIAKEVASIDAKNIVVLSNKHSIYERPDLFSDKDSYYRYMFRLLLERITDCCSDWRTEVKDGNGKVKIIFATRKGMSYEVLKEYLNNIKNSETVNNKIKEQNLPKINWNIIDIESVENIPSSKRVGLQFADVLSYSFYKAVAKNKFDMVNISFCKYFKKVMYNKDARIWHNGVFITNISELPKEEHPKELMKIYNPRKNPGKTKITHSISLTPKLSETAKIMRRKQKK